MTGPLRLAAPAKLNLSLRVTGRRPDGFHELAGVMALLELEDELLLLPGCSGLRLTGSVDPSVPVSPGENLAWRGLAAGLGAEPVDCCLALEKRIPAQAGLGGGSSDGGAGWRLGRRWAGLPAAPSAADLRSLADIGADVPFFAAGLAAATVGGIGERLEALSALPDARDVLLVHPPFGLATGAVFAELRQGEWSSSGAPVDAPPGHNDLLAPALRLRPEIEDLVRLVLAAGLEPHLTGSGPTLYARTEDPERLRAAARRLDRAGVRTTHTRLRAEPARIEAVGDAPDEEDA